MEEMFILFLQVIADIIGLIMCIFPFNVALYLYERPQGNRTGWKCFFLFLWGVVIGVVSFIVLPKSIVPYEWLRLATLFLAPFFAGGWSYGIAVLVSRNKEAWPVRHFWYSFVGCLGVVAVRFAFAARV